MKIKKIVVCLLALIVCFLTVPGGVSAASGTSYSKESAKGTASKNVQTNGYNGRNWASPMYSYLYEWKNNLYRLEYTGGKIIFEKYNSDFKYLGKGEIKQELPIFGGFFAGENYNFILFGDKNTSESNSKEVLRVVKYTKGMKRVSSKSFYGCNTYVPFDAGCPPHGRIQRHSLHSHEPPDVQNFGRFAPSGKYGFLHKNFRHERRFYQLQNF